jgi:hypothetical protein
MNHIQINRHTRGDYRRKPADNLNRGINTGIASGILIQRSGKNYQKGRN